MRILILVPELDSDLVVRETKKLFSKLIVMLLLPLLGEELNNLIGSLDEVITISPGGVGCVYFCYVFWISSGMLLAI